jgi:hypothetical protein
MALRRAFFVFVVVIGPKATVPTPTIRPRCEAIFLPETSAVVAIINGFDIYVSSPIMTRIQKMADF